MTCGLAVHGEVVVVDSITELGFADRGQVAVTASHGGRYGAYLAAALGLHGVVFNDAGVGRDGAGIVGLTQLEGFGIPAATVGHMTARIGDGEDTWTNGVVTYVNKVAERAGVAVGASCRAAAELMSRHVAPRAAEIPPPFESVLCVSQSAPAVWAFDSASLVGPDYDGTFAITGSHGGLLGGDPRRAIKGMPAFAAFNDAGVGKERAGLGRLAPLEALGIPAVTVAASSARIGDGLSTYHDGVLSACNESAAKLGGEPGMPLREFVQSMRRQLTLRAWPGNDEPSRGRRPGEGVPTTEAGEAI
jgi:hypothetical protein